MTDAELEEDEYPDQEHMRPSLAFPPFHVLRTADRCPECGRAVHVYALGCTAFQDAGDRYVSRQFHFLTLLRSLPEALLSLLKTRCPSLYLDREHQTNART